MGEYADMAVDDMLEIDYGHLTGRFNCDDDPYWNPFSGRWSRFTPRPKTCKRCGAKNLWWGQHEGRWLLEESDGSLHKCSFSFKAFFGSDAYNRYLDTVPPPTEVDIRC